MISLLLSFFVSLSAEAGIATTYFPGDGHSGRYKADGTEFTKQDDHIAHRTLPLGTSGYLCSFRTGLCARTIVRDRGPFGAKLHCGKIPHKTNGIGLPTLVVWGRVCYWLQTQTRLQKGWRYRGTFDLSIPVSEAIGHRAFDGVVFFYQQKTDHSSVAMVEIDTN